MDPEAAVQRWPLLRGNNENDSDISRETTVRWRAFELTFRFLKDKPKPTDAERGSSKLEEKTHHMSSQLLDEPVNA